ncbi:hypothetical protein INT44_006562 [Umbelopsis vinacea]|uniref:FHA domain-containing protein n=1 Tax=Umbelopsis vinacea TaxID=44442 RepID=A0A8H7PSI1_9FUNG|nr:hypothetical protein INT44_006562 [Umbelopsis vinacea]
MAPSPPRPKLAGFSWTHYITEDNVILGRSPTDNDNKQKDARHISFGTSKAISRKHAEIKHNPDSNRWELLVYGRNGVKLNGLYKKPPCKPVSLDTGALIDIDGNQFVFVLPVTSSGINGSANHQVDHTPSRILQAEETIESLIVDAIESTTSDLTVSDIMFYVKNQHKAELRSPVTLEKVTKILLSNSQFQLASGCFDSTSPDAVWTIVSDQDPVDFLDSQDPPSRPLLRREASFQRETFSKSVVSSRNALGIEWFYVISLDVNSQPMEVNIQRDYERFTRSLEHVPFVPSRKRPQADVSGLPETRALKRIRTAEPDLEREISTVSLTVSDIFDYGSPLPHEKEAITMVTPSRTMALSDWTDAGPSNIGLQIAQLKLDTWHSTL